MLRRRDFIQKTAVAGSILSLASVLAASHNNVPSDDLETHIFSKHLQFLNYQEMAKAAKEIGFDGVELTVRPGGHVLPERVEEDLPKAVAAVREQGLKADMIVTAITKSNALARNILETAAGLGAPDSKRSPIECSVH